jgi:hypothetical protein
VRAGETRSRVSLGVIHSCSPCITKIRDEGRGDRRPADEPKFRLEPTDFLQAEGLNPLGLTAVTAVTAVTDVSYMEFSVGLLDSWALVPWTFRSSFSLLFKCLGQRRMASSLPLSDRKEPASRLKWELRAIYPCPNASKTHWLHRLELQRAQM